MERTNRNEPKKQELMRRSGGYLLCPLASGRANGES